jgi:AraC family transcriptional regulator, regulatory protein of adaptative response / DNA-3-methyladenine glycosylase II
VRAFLAVRAVPGVEAVDGDTYCRTITVGGAPGLLEISSGGAGYLLLRAHLPYWEGLIHVVGRAGRLLGIDVDHTAGAAALRAVPVLGSLVAARPGLAVPGAWSPFEAGVWAILNRGSDAGPAAGRLEAFVTSLGTPVPGLPGDLSHTFPEPEAVASASRAATGLPAADATAVAALAAAMAETAVAEAGHAGYAIGPGALATLPGVDQDVRDYLAFRLGQRDAFPLADPSLGAALEDLGLCPADAAPWRPWLALAAVHLMAHGDTIQRQTCYGRSRTAWPLSLCSSAATPRNLPLGKSNATTPLRPTQ